MQTIWLSPAGFVTGDPTLRASYPFMSHPSTIVSCTTPGDFKWVSMGLRLPPDTQIGEVVICYEVSNARSFIAQVRLAEMTTPDRATVIHDDPAALTSTTPTSYTSAVPAVVPSGAVTLQLRLNFHDPGDEILLGAVGIAIESLTSLSASYPTLVNVKEFGAKGDGQRVNDAQITSGSSTLYSPTATFTSADVGKLFTLYGAGAAGAVLTGTICALVDPHDGKSHQIKLSTTASATVGQNLPGTVSVTQYSQNITFSTDQTIYRGTPIVFASQAGQPYNLLADLVAGTAGTIVNVPGPYQGKTGYLGTTNAATTCMIQGVFRWGTDDYAAIVAAMNGALAVISGTTFSAVGTVYFPPGEYCVSRGVDFSSTYTGLTVRGSGEGENSAVEPASRSRITLMSRATTTYLWKEHSASSHKWYLWFCGNRLADRVIDFEYFTVTQTWHDCVFDGATVSGALHYYGLYNGVPLEVDNLYIYNPDMEGDCWDGTYTCGYWVYNLNANAFSGINYYDGVYAGAAEGVHFFQGSCNFLGTPQFNYWTNYCFYIDTECWPFVIEGPYNERANAPFLKISADRGGTRNGYVEISNAILNTTATIYTAHTMGLVLRNCQLGGNVHSDPASATTAFGVAYGTAPLILDHVSFVNGAALVQDSGTGGLIHIRDVETTDSGNIEVIDGAMNSSVSPTHLACTTSAPFNSGHVGKPIVVAGAGSGGANLVGNITSVTDSSHAVLNVSCLTTVTNAQVDFSNNRTTVTDGAINSGSKTLTCTTLTPFAVDYSVGEPITVYGAGTSGVNLNTWITAFTDSGHVTLADAAGTNVTSAIVEFGNVVAGTFDGTNSTMYATKTSGGYDVVGITGYDADGLYLGHANTPNPKPSVVPILCADVHFINSLTSSRTYYLSRLGAQIGQRMAVTHVDSSDAYNAIIHYDQVAPKTVYLAPGQWAEFEFTLSRGWFLRESGTDVTDTGNGNVYARAAADLVADPAGGNFKPKTDATILLGTSALRWNQSFITAGQFFSLGGLQTNSLPLTLQHTSINVNGVATTTLSAAQYACPKIYITGILNNNPTNVVFPNTNSALYVIDCNGATFGGNTLVLKAGAGRSVSVVAASKLVLMVTTDGSANLDAIQGP